MLPAILAGYRSLLRFRNPQTFRRRLWLEVGTSMEVPIGCQASGRDGAKPQPAPSQYQRSHCPWLSQAGQRAIIAWLRLYLGGSGGCAGDCFIRFQIGLFLMSRLRVVVLTRWRVFCSMAATTFLRSLGESSRYAYTCCCSSALKLGGRPLRGRAYKPTKPQACQRTIQADTRRWST